jgi:hypothetical protein
MTDLKKAAQQALEALDSEHPDIQLLAAAALRAALEQQTQTPCDIAEDGVCEVIDCCRNRPQILEALEIGYDSAQAEAAQYHAAMAGYRPERHAEMDANVAKIAKAITAVKAALEQPEQEPVAPYAWMAVGGTIWRRKTSEDDVPLYTAPPRREWQGLTEEDMEDLLPLYSDPSANTEMLEFAAAIEAKLKETNHG